VVKWLGGRKIGPLYGEGQSSRQPKQKRWLKVDRLGEGRRRGFGKLARYGHPVAVHFIPV